MFECHGSYETGHCLDCTKKYSIDDYIIEIKEGKVKYCECGGVNGLARKYLVNGIDSILINLDKTNDDYWFNEVYHMDCDEFSNLAIKELKISI